MGRFWKDLLKTAGKAVLEKLMEKLSRLKAQDTRDPRDLGGK